MVDLGFGQGTVAKQTVISLVDEVENRIAIGVDKPLAAGGSHGVELESGLHNLGNALHLLGNGVGDLYFELHPIYVFLKSHAFQVLGIVGVVIDGGLGAELIKTLDQATLGVHVGKSQWTCELSHPFAATPLLHCCHEAIGHLGIVDKIDKAKPSLLLAHALVNHLVDDACDATHGLTIAIGHEVGALAKLKCGVLAGHERFNLVGDQAGHIIGVVAVDCIDGEVHKLEQIALAGCDFSYFYSHCDYTN